MTNSDEIPWTQCTLAFPPFESTPVRVPDMLATMMMMQARHMDHYCDPFNELPDTLTRTFDVELTGQWDARPVHESFRRTMGYCVEEIMEAVGLFKGKPWKQKFEAPDRDKVMDEIGDALHFFFEACLVLGLTPEDLFLAYFKASDKNVARQNGDY